MKKSLLLSAMLSVAATSVFAIPNPIPSANDLPEFNQFDTPITVPSYADRVIYKYNPPTPGTLTAYVKGGDASLFVSATYYAEDYTVLGGNYGNGPVETPLTGYNYGYSYKMTPDKQYYIALPAESYNTASTVYFTWEEIETAPTALTSVSPAPSATESFDYISVNDIVIKASEGVSSAGNVSISYNGKSVDIPGSALVGPPNDLYLSIPIAKIGGTNYAKMAADDGATSFAITINKLYSNGVPVTINNTKNENVKVEDGVVTMTYAVSKAANYMPEQSTWPSTFYSYWQQGDADGIATLVFDEPIMSVDRVTVAMATVVPNSEGGSETQITTYSIENVMADGNKLLIDFTGVEYQGNTKQVTVIVETVKGQNGLPAYMGENGVSLFQYISYSAQAAPENPSSVSSLGAEPVNAPVYNLNGQKAGDSLKGLAPGIYIVNGKKVIVK